VLRWNAEDENCHGKKNRDIPTQDRHREMLDPLTEADAERRCRVMPQV
jgi:hypothetical protein